MLVETFYKSFLDELEKIAKFEIEPITAEERREAAIGTGGFLGSMLGIMKLVEKLRPGTEKFPVIKMGIPIILAAAGLSALLPSRLDYTLPITRLEKAIEKQKKGERINKERLQQAIKNYKEMLAEEKGDFLNT